MKMQNYIVRLLGGWTQEEVDEYRFNIHCLKCEEEKTYTLGELNTISKLAFYAGKEYESYPKWVNSIQKKSEKHISQKRENSKYPKQKVSRVAYNGPLGDKIPAYSIRTDKKTDNTLESNNKNVVKNKKKVRPIK